MEVENLLDRIETKEKVRYGIIDFVSKKQIIFYDLSNNDSLSLRIAILSWRLYGEEKERFSHFCKTNFEDFPIPSPIIIPILSISNKENIDLQPTNLNKKVRNV